MVEVVVLVIKVVHSNLLDSSRLFLLPLSRLVPLALLPLLGRVGSGLGIGLELL